MRGIRGLVLIVGTLVAAGCGDGGGGGGADALTGGPDGGGGAADSGNGSDSGSAGPRFYALDYDGNFLALDANLQEASSIDVGAPEGYEPLQLIYADARFVAVFDGLGLANKVYSSANGTSWSELTLDAQVTSVRSVAFGEGRWVFGAQSGLAYSDDLSQFTVVAGTAANAGWVVSYFADVSGGTFIATSGDAFGTTLQYSTDGAAWTGSTLTTNQSAIFALRSVGGDLISLGTAGQISHSTDGGASFTDTTSLAGAAYYSLGQGMSMLVAVGTELVNESGTRYAHYSTDGGQSFLDGDVGTAEPGPGHTLFDSRANRFLHVDNNFDGYYASTDGMTWTATGLDAAGRASTIIPAP